MSRPAQQFQPKRSQSMLRNEIPPVLNQNTFSTRNERKPKEKSQTTSNDSENRLENRVNVQSFVKTKSIVKKDDNKKSDQSEISTSKLLPKTKTNADLVLETDVDQLLEEPVGLKGPSAAVQHSAVGDKFKIMETSSRIEKVLKENHLFKEIGKDKIMEAMMQLLSQKQGSNVKQAKPKSATKSSTQSFGTLVSQNQKTNEAKSLLPKQNKQKQHMQTSVLQNQKQKQKKGIQTQNFSKSNSSTRGKMEPIVQLKEIPKQEFKEIKETKKPSSENSGGNQSGNTIKTAQFVPETPKPRSAIAKKGEDKILAIIS